MSENRVPFTGNLRTLWADASVVGPLDTAAEVTATLVLRRRAEPDDAAFDAAPLTVDELAERYGAQPDDLEAVRAAVTAAGAEVVAADAGTRLVQVRGAAQAVNALFGTELREVRLADGASAYQPNGELALSAELGGLLVGVLGLDNRPQAATRYAVAGAAAATSGYTPLQIAQAYDLPPSDGAGQTIAIIELGGGFAQSDLDAYFAELKLTSPKVTAVGVDGATNVAGKDPQGADGEVLLDIEVAGAIAPAAAQVVYFAPNTDSGFLDAITQAAHATPAPTTMSISWGQSEDQWSASARTAMDNACADAALLGVTVTAAAGDNGSTDNQSGSAPHADFPASSPHVLGCGGTHLTIDSSGTASAETVWDDGGQGGATGGGISDAFPVPAYQKQAGLPKRAGAGGKVGRGVPDVAGDADPQTGYKVRVDGTDTVFGGTSAVAPLWAGLICRLAAELGKPLGLVHTKLYAGATATASPPGFRDITEGSNGAYSADAGWDACTGLGVPDGAKLLAALRAAK
ncbi:protease pro-enzyme activation domain-containing protein [uncultured Jatrophihabitans sp.]|uniref:S53 family peptidase n=1 Tax=uncultured Jatrophihabitans sp. TaxID=1610747 RepID=UPI0035CA06D3